MSTITRDKAKQHRTRIEGMKVGDTLTVASMKLYRSDNSSKFKVHHSRNVRIEKWQIQHNPSFLITYLPGIFFSTSRQYAYAYPQPNVYEVSFKGKLFDVEKQWKELPEGMDFKKVVGWMRSRGYSGAFGRRSAVTSEGIFDEVVIFDQKNVKIIKEQKK